MKLTEHILTGNDCWKAGRTIVPKGVMVHSPGVAQDDVNVFLKAWDQPGAERCVHAFVTREGAVQTLPWNWRGWHAGVPAEGGVSANNTHISFEMLEPDGHAYQGAVMVGYDVKKNAEYFAAVYRNAVELTAMLCAAYHLDPAAPGVVISHAEGHVLGVASNHADVGQWFPKHGKSMDDFRADVARVMEGGSAELTQAEFDRMFRAALADWESEQGAGKASLWAVEAWEKAVRAGVFAGARPRSPLSREQAALVLDRLGLLEK